jgi:uncharacterized protein (DUF983 family)
MKKKNPMTFTMSIVAIIVGAALYREINFRTMTVEKPALAIIYVITFLLAVFVLVKNFRKQGDK